MRRGGGGGKELRGECGKRTQVLRVLTMNSEFDY